MKCCRCGEEMLVVEYAQIEIDYCADCGIWLDFGELELILGEAGEPVGGEAPPPSAMERDDKPIKCPVCHRKMNRGRYDELTSSVVDLCPKEHGIWLDRGELREIVETKISGDAADRTAVISFLSNLFGEEAS